MSEETNEYTTLLLRLPVALKARLQREAFVHDRKVTAEINYRLKESLDRREDGNPQPEQRLVAMEEITQYGLSQVEQALLEVFRRMPPEKQLALLSLFK